MPQSMIVKRVSFAFALFIFLSGAMGADNSSGITALRRDIEGIKAAQEDIQKNLLSLRSTPTGKHPRLDNLYLDVSGEPALENRDAPVSVIEFSDLQYPFFCAYARETLGRIVADYVETGMPDQAIAPGLDAGVFMAESNRNAESRP
jgi:protein-disulfide isomerase